MWGKGKRFPPTFRPLVTIALLGTENMPFYMRAVHIYLRAESESVSTYRSSLGVVGQIKQNDDDGAEE